MRTVAKKIIRPVGGSLQGFFCLWRNIIWNRYQDEMKNLWKEQEWLLLRRQKGTWEGR